MSAQSAPRPPTRRQDPEIRGNPYAATFRSSGASLDNYLVQSASSHYRYLVTLFDNAPDDDTCTCPAHGPCWHIDAARLRREIDRVAANSANLYHTWQLAELVDEDQRIRTLLAEADSWLVRAQWSVVGDRIGELTERVAA